MLRIHNRSGSVIHSRWENAPRSLAKLPGASSLQLSGSCLLLEHVAAMILLRLSHTSEVRPGTRSPGSLPIPFPLLFQFSLQFSQDQDESAEADKSLGGGSHLPSQTTLTLEGSTALQTRLPTKRRPGIAKKPEVKPNIWTSIFLNSIFFKI